MIKPFRLIKGSLRRIFRRRKGASPSPSLARRSTFSTWTGTSKKSAIPCIGNGGQPITRSLSSHLSQRPILARPSPAQSDAPSPTDRNQRLTQPKQDIRSISVHTTAGLQRCRSSACSRDLLPPQDFAPQDLEKVYMLSQPKCRRRIGYVSQPYPEPGLLRVVTRPRSPEWCFITRRPLYSANRHSPLITDRPYTIYFEGEIKLWNSEDPGSLALGFIAGKDRASRMPGFERWSIGIHDRDGRLYLNNNAVGNIAMGAFEPGQRLGIGITFSVNNRASRQADDTQVPTDSSPLTDVELFLSKHGERVGTWNLRDQLRQSEELSLEGLEGAHDLYAAVGTIEEVNIDILFDGKHWEYQAEA